MSKQFVHLHVHTEYSMLDGAAKLKPLFAEAERLGQPAIAMTDHGNMYGGYAFYQQAKGSGVKPILGIEAYLAPHDRFHKKPTWWGEPSQRSDDLSGAGSYTHMTMVAKNNQGARNLFRLSSQASFEGYYYKPRMDRELISQNSEGIVATTGCPSGEVQTRLRLGQTEAAYQAASDYRDIFGADNYFLEIMDHGNDIEQRVKAELYELGRKMGLPPLVTNDSHFVTEEQKDTHAALLCVQSGSTLDDPKRFKFSGEGYFLRSADQMYAVRSDQIWQEGCQNTLLVAEMVEDYDEIFAPQDRMPTIDVPEGHDQGTYLRELVELGLKERFGGDVPAEYTARAELELDVIIKAGYPSYFLVVADLISHARSIGIYVGPGRGSAAGSLVAYAMKITNIDPIHYGLLFERFLNPERVSMPDIDIDFDDRRRGEMITYATEKYGKEFVAQVITFGTIKTKAALKDAARVHHGQPGFSIAERITKALPPPVAAKDIPLEGITDPNHPRYKEAGEVRGLIENDGEVRQIFDTALGLEGLIRNAGVHACAVILSSQPLVDCIPMWARPDGSIITGWDYPSCEDIGLLKMDFLGLRNLTVIGDAVEAVKANRGIDIDLDTLPVDDPKAYELLARGDTLGVFQLDGTAMRELLKRMKPTEFNDIVAVLALYRPGPMEANSHNNYADRKNGRQELTPIHPELADALEEILAETYGLIVYQEQIMKIAQKLAGFTMGQADVLRKAMGKKKLDVLEKMFAEFEAGMVGNGFSKESIKTLWDIMLPFAGYAFNKSHAAGYGLVSYWTAYLKANFPAEYMAGLLTSVGDSKDKAAVYLSECRKMGITVMPPDVNESRHVFHPVGEDIRYGMGAIRNVGANVVSGIIEAREGQGNFDDFKDFLKKVPAQVCNKRTVESLIKAGAFDSLGHARRGLAEVHEKAIDAMVSIKKEEARGQFDLFGGMVEATDTLGVDLTIADDEWERRDKLAFEREMLGLYVSDHPLNGFERLLSSNADRPVAALHGEEIADGSNVRVAGILQNVAKRVTKQGKLWASATLEDLAGSIEVRFFPNTYELVSDSLADDLVCCVKGKLDRRDGTAQLIAQDLAVLDTSTGPEANNSPITVALKAAAVNPDLIEKLSDTFKTHRGEAQVRVQLAGGSGMTMLALDDQWRVRPSVELSADLKALLGAGAVVG
ncbi:DNA polymerase III subunit alpha [Glycomyces buryatensis]|uniref:DNA polymerase III subunit alpha n=1 Tax=Glycomyces buryatensis TaxID=2570927 RepID=A0A4S8QF95_9ACTN|nr:DNA polymerase III subunit alpha [Glycomyces buryatensis]THV41595.1 DNA polymerase III subunit alpha [Glycomyces buryatensis]